MTAMWWAGLIWAIACGWASSSYASSFIFRLPRKEYPFGRRPYCDECNALLQPKDLFPVFSYWLTGGKCRYCGCHIPLSYYLLELFLPLIFIVAYIQWGFGDVFILSVFGFSTLMVVVMHAYESGYYSSMVMLALAITGALLQTMLNGNITSCLISAFICFLVTVGWYRFDSKTSGEIDLRSLPPYTWMAGVMGCWLPLAHAFAGLILWMTAIALLKDIWKAKHPATVTAACYAAVLTLLVFYSLQQGHL